MGLGKAIVEIIALIIIIAIVAFLIKVVAATFVGILILAIIVGVGMIPRGKKTVAIVYSR